MQSITGIEYFAYRRGQRYWIVKFVFCGMAWQATFSVPQGGFVDNFDVRKGPCESEPGNPVPWLSVPAQVRAFSRGLACGLYGEIFGHEVEA